MAHRIAVSIINYRTGALTIQCIRSVLDDLTGIDARIVVVDNCSHDGSAEEIEAWIADQPDTAPVQLVRSADNGGFSAGHNQGIAAVRADYYLILNSDTLLRAGFFKSLLAAADAAPTAGLIAPRLTGEDGTVQTSCFRFPSPYSELIRGANSGPVTRALKRHEVALGPHPDPARIEWASFACILLRADMIRDIGPMDEGYFLYFEDAEYSLRAARAGWQIAHEPRAVAVHFRGGSGPVKTLATARKRLPAYYYRSRSRFFCQAHGRAGLLAANLLWVGGRAVAQLRRLAGKSVPPMIEAERRDIWINAITPLAGRAGASD